jgi:hypothetical protein
MLSSVGVWVHASQRRKRSPGCWARPVGKDQGWVVSHQHGDRATPNIGVNAATRVLRVRRGHEPDPVGILQERQIRWQGFSVDGGQLVRRFGDLSVLVEPYQRVAGVERPIVLGGEYLMG